MTYCKISTVLVIFAVISSIKCRGIVDETARISNGNVARPHQFPWHAAIIYADSIQPFCGGSLIAADWVLTAEHCVQGGWLPRIMAGHVNRSDPQGTGGVIVEVEKIIGYKAEQQPGDHDIALLKLKSPLLENEFIKYAKLPTKETAFEDKIAYAIGHGQTDHTGQIPLPDNILYTELHMRLRNQCPATYICTSEVYPKAGVCPGDSGGSLVLKDTNIILGAAHAINKACGSPDLMSFYANVILYLDWIREKTGITP